MRGGDEPISFPRFASATFPKFLICIVRNQMSGCTRFSVVLKAI
nr:MAG TPA: hypothetical protein [Caudoviricetes sp.]